ncbi:MAG: DUF1566 domain-containing protein [Myxococcaceae bacterium]|nr:DUF1566 domain-containing protein [Myxococcaceae bacterium]MBH2005860.1 DUF1566 domain-containing protein [Myxococcaceae bacterium]
MAPVYTFLAILSGALAQFSITSGFSDSFHHAFKNLSNDTEGRNAIRALLSLTAGRIKQSPSYQMPFELNCTVIYDHQVKRVDCFPSFKNVPWLKMGCEERPVLTEGEREQAAEYNLLQARIVVGASKEQMLQSNYWIRRKQTVTKTDFQSESIARTESYAVTRTPMLTDTGSQSWGVTEQESCSATDTPTLRMNGLFAMWNASAGIYANAIAQPGRYAISNGVVTDTLTQIQWEQTAGTDTMLFSFATSYCSARSTAGFKDWRSPNIIELATLVDYTRSTPPFLDLSSFPGAPASNFWSSTDYFGNPGNSWYLRSSTDGAVEYQANSMSLPVRCIRTNYSIFHGFRYSIGTGNLNGTVMDIVTGLTWQRVTPLTSYSQSGGAVYCAALDLGGFSSGWRLPTVRELLSLVDYSQIGSAARIEPTAFPGEPADTFWSSTGSWDIWFNEGYFGRGSSNHRVRCVRN